MGLKAKCLFGIFQKNCSSGVSHVIVRCLLITISSSNRAPDYPTGAWTCSFFKHEHTLYVSFLSCVDHTWYGFWVLEIFSWAIEATDTAENGADYITPAYDYPMWRWQPPMFMPCQLLSRIHEDTNYIQTVCQQCWTPPNCLPALLNMAQLFAIIAQLLATIVKHRPNVFQFCQRPINCLPITCHFDQQIKSVKFSWFFVFLSK